MNTPRLSAGAGKDKGEKLATGWFRLPDALLTEHGQQIGAVGVAVFAALAQHADRHGACFPSYNRLARLLALSRRQTIRTVRLLKDLGLIIVSRRGGGKAANHYRLPPLSPPADHGGGGDPTPRGSEGGDTGSPVTQSHRSGDCQSPRVVTNSHPNQTQSNQTQSNQIPTPPLPPSGGRGGRGRAARDTPATPRKRGAKKRPAVPRPRDRLFDAVAEVTGLDPRLAGSKIGRVCSALREGDPPYTPEEVRLLPDLLSRRGFTLPLLPWSIPDYIGLVRKTHGGAVGNWLEMSAEELVVALKPLPNDQAKAVVESLPPDKQEAYFRARDSAWEAEPYVPG